METVTITLNAAQSKALAHWVRTFAWDYNLDSDLEDPKNAQYAVLFNDIQRAALALNPPKVRIAEEA